MKPQIRGCELIRLGISCPSLLYPGSDPKLRGWEDGLEKWSSLVQSRPSKGLIDIEGKGREPGITGGVTEREHE
jgi:hypothetical protein